MSQKGLQERLETEIPVIRALGVKVLEVSASGAEVRAPMTLNSNHIATAFGGSIYSILVISAYAYLLRLMEQASFRGHIVIQSGTIDYKLPVVGEIVGLCEPLETATWETCRASLERKSRARVPLNVFEGSQESPRALFRGTFVIILDGSAKGG